MNNREYKECLAEVLAILNDTESIYVHKIPVKVLNFIKKNAAKDYPIAFDTKGKIEDMPLKEGTKGLLSLIYMDYWANEKQKKEFQKILIENEKKRNQEIAQELNKKEIFKKDIVENKTEKSIAIRKENWITKIIKQIKKRLKNDAV